MPVTVSREEEEAANLWEDLEDIPIEYEEFDSMFSRPVINKGPKKKDDKKQSDSTKVNFTGLDTPL